jgi:hypothetical protein
LSERVRAKQVEKVGVGVGGTSKNG